jgi:hypothetical protein
VATTLLAVMGLSPEDREHCQDLTTQLLDRTLFDCEELGLDSGSHANLDSKRWKKLQSHADETLYADRGPNAVNFPGMHREDWENPVGVVALGRMNCSLDDVLLALVTPDVATQRLRSLLLGRRSETNYCHEPIVRPTQTSPFQSLAVIRYVNSQHWPFTMFVGPREVVLACATGEVVSADGRRVGYEIIQSVALQDRFARSSSLPRSHVVKARVFWELPDGSVSFYSKLLVDAKQLMPDAVKQSMLCRVVVDFWKFVPRCAEMKKLRWCMKNRKLATRGLASLPQSTGCAGCGIMKQKSQSSSSSEKRCELCERWLCGDSYCLASCQVKMVHCSETKMYEQTLMVCPQCIAFVRSQSAVDVARSEIVDGQNIYYGAATGTEIWEQVATD